MKISELTPDPRSLAYSDAFQAVEWLNATKGTASYRRVLAVRQELEELGTAFHDLRMHLIEAIKSRIDARKMDEVSSLSEQFRQRHNALNRMLARYAHVPALAYNVETSVWRFGMVPKRSRGKEIKLEDQFLTVRINESSVISALARLAANRELYKVRLCEHCVQCWRVSERKIDRFCSKKCREAFYAKSEDFLKRKAKNQRLYRQNQKERDERQFADSLRKNESPLLHDGTQHSLL
ncbi:MAG TPA: hypothetical protein VMV42_00390 [archaeon]|nr:hypothetical protein [archaeon]